MKKIVFEIGYGSSVESLHCEKCGFNVTEKNRLESAMSTLKQQMTKQVKIIKVGTGLGMRFPNDLVKNMNLKKGKELILEPDNEGIRMKMES
jgi:hypothetical protein